ncbi:MAG TPA: serine hydrolase domain-containing protein [Lachnospiraceae bacterium]
MNFDKLTEYLESLEESYGIPASDIKVTKGYETVYRHQTGYSDYEKTKRVDDTVLYRLFSATKVITMVAVMQLIERGELGFYDEVRKYLPEFGMMKVADSFVFKFPIHWPKSEEACHYAKNPIRIIDLMTMTAGLSYDTTSEELNKIRQENPNATTREVMTYMAKMPLIYEPGTRYAYSLAHDVLAAVVEVVSKKRYSEYLKENIFSPLDIKDLYFHWEEQKEISDRICAMYMGVFGSDEITRDNGLLSGSFKITKNYESGGAGLVGSVDAYSKIIEALANDGKGANGARILSKESVRSFMVSYTKGEMSKDFALSGKLGYEYGLGVRVLVDERKAKSPKGEFGWDGAAGAYVLVDPIHNVSIFYAQHIVGFPKVYSEIHPVIRDLVYEGLEKID